MRDKRGSGRAIAALAAVLALGGCAGGAGAPAIHAGDECAACGMAIHDLRYASARGVRGAARTYDAIECLLRDSTATGPAWLPDWDQATLHAADSMWVVQGELPSPMGGGFAAFLDRATADEIATTRSGVVGRLADFTWKGPR